MPLGSFPNTRFIIDKRNLNGSVFYILFPPTNLPAFRFFFNFQAVPWTQGKDSSTLKASPRLKMIDAVIEEGLVQDGKNTVFMINQVKIAF